MGFRVPLTTATAVDTGPPAGAGARLYQGSDAGGVFGVLEFRDGIGDPPAQVIGRANLVAQGGGAFTAQGGSLTLKGGAYNGVTAPELDLNVEGLGAGGYGSIARLSAPDGFYVNGQPFARPRLSSIPRQSAALSDSFPGNGAFVPLITGTVLAAPPGDYLIVMTMVLSGSVAAGGNAQLLVNNADVLGSPRSDVVAQAQPNTFVYPLSGYAGGDMALVATQSVVAGTATIYTRASRIVVAYLGPDS